MVLFQLQRIFYRKAGRIVSKGTWRHHGRLTVSGKASDRGPRFLGGAKILRLCSWADDPQFRGSIQASILRALEWTTCRIGYLGEAPPQKNFGGGP